MYLILPCADLFNPKLGLLGKIAEGSISTFAYNHTIYICAKFGAFRQKCTIGPILGAMPPDY